MNPETKQRKIDNLKRRIEQTRAAEADQLLEVKLLQGNIETLTEAMEAIEAQDADE